MKAPETQKLYDIFNAGRLQYQVPVYQRNYAWDEDNWASLWEDIEGILDRHLNDPGSQPPPRHFLGAIVIELQHFGVGGMETRFVIDGQQRLTTSQLLLAAAAMELEERGATGQAAELRSLTLNHDQAAVGDLRFKIWPAKANRDAFKAVIEGAAADGEGMAGAFWFFRRSITAWLESPPRSLPAGDPEDASPTPELIAERMTGLHTALRDLVYAVTINLDEDDNAQVIFETLNARGTPLSALDLTKNGLFLQAERAGLSEEVVADLHDAHWQPVFEADRYWQEEETQGRDRRSRGEWFLFHWLAMELGEVVGTKDLYDAFRRKKLVADDRPPIEELLITLCRDAQTYRHLWDQPAGSPERMFFHRLGTLDTTTVLPLVLLLFRSPEVTQTVRRRGLAAVESWLVRRALLRYQSRAYNRLATRLLAAAKRDLTHADVEIVAELRGWTANTDLWPSDEVLQRTFVEEQFYNRVGQARVRLALEACEQMLRDGPKTEPVELPDGLSIEHAMPQDWGVHWPSPDGGDDEALAARAARVDRIGNLTLVTTPLNSAMKHSPWTKASAVDPTAAPHEKRIELEKHSVLLLNQRLCEAEIWDDEAIDARSGDLAELIATAWPGPAADCWDSEQA
jgi:Protein of unknown function DUF262/Protein of unknown function (DUF1524)